MIKPDIARYLENDKDLMPLLKDYLSRIDPDIKETSIYTEDDVMNEVVFDSMLHFGDTHYGFIENPDGSVGSFKMDVVSSKDSGSYAIRDGYWRALAGCLQKDLAPSSIRVVSIISDAGTGGSGNHWTSSVATLSLDPSIFDMFKKNIPDHFLKSNELHVILNKMNIVLKKHYEDESINIMHDDRLKGVTDIQVAHYDSHLPNDINGGFYKKYKKTLQSLTDNNKGLVSVQSKDCNKQRGNTCGDNSIYNGFLAGVLGLDPGDNAFQIDSISLRSYTEGVISSKRVDNMVDVSEKLENNIKNVKTNKGVVTEKEEKEDDQNKIQSLPEFIALKQIASNLEGKYQELRNSTGWGRWLKSFSKEKTTRKEQIGELQKYLNAYIEDPQRNIKALELALQYLETDLEAENHKLGKSGLSALVTEIQDSLAVIKKEINEPQNVTQRENMRKT